MACCALLLPAHAGYECKEAEPGKFTLAFQSLEDALRWCAALQHRLLRLHWPRRLLAMEDCVQVGLLVSLLAAALQP